MSDNRKIGRDSLFLMADLRREGAAVEERIRVRNLSAGGMMGEGPMRVVTGEIVAVNLHNIGWVEGSVAWVQEDRFGVAFREEIDSKRVRAATGDMDEDAGHTPRHLRALVQQSPSREKLRKI
ncbi:MAG: PilZ domain-containing protein [Novosphingobium sp.]|nr:PilZ domain-containing protein [Novosphingobium sp.]